MADQDRAPGDVVTVEQALERKPFDFDFYHALRWMECRHADKPRLGRSLRLADEPIRLVQKPSLAFAPATLSAYGTASDTGQPTMSVNFFGLLGPNGPLPTHLTEYAIDRLNGDDDQSFVRFLDIFHQRMLALFYRAWADAQPTVQFDRPASDRFAIYIGSLFGLGMPALRNREPVSDLAKFHHAGHLSAQTHYAEGLESVLEGYFQVPVSVREFIAEWVTLPDDCRCRLAEWPNTASLGETTILGTHIWQCQHKFRIALGPLCLSDYERFLPGDYSLARLVALVRQYVGDELDWDLNLVLQQDEVPPIKLGEMGRLGCTTWLAGEPLSRDADDLLLQPSYWASLPPRRAASEAPSEFETSRAAAP